MRAKILVILTILFVLNLYGYAQLDSAFVSGGAYYLKVKDIGALFTNSSHQSWRNIQNYLNEPPSKWYWDTLDSDVQNFQSVGIDLYITIICVSPLDTPLSKCDSSYGKLGSNLQSWFPRDTIKWKAFIDALLQRYGGFGNGHMPGLLWPVTHWHIEQEWQRIWCSNCCADTSLTVAQDFSRYVNMTYNEIKKIQQNSVISFAGIDIRHQSEAFHDGYPNDSTICLNLSGCNTKYYLKPAQLEQLPSFMPDRRNVLYIIRNSKFDELDIHSYGRWQNIPDVIKWLKDTAGVNKPIIFLEGGGPLCKDCEPIYHSAQDTDGILLPQLVRDNASYVVYYFMVGLANKIKRLHWNLGPEYNWGAMFGDLDLRSINYVNKPSYYVYRFLVNDIFANPNSDSVVRIPDSNQKIYHYQIKPLGLDVVWSTDSNDTYVVNGTGKLYRWDIPIRCNSNYPIWCDSIVKRDSIDVSGSTTIVLSNRVPVFYSWNNVIGTGQGNEENIPLQFKLFQNYPNPFNPKTTIRFWISKKSLVTLKVFDVLGREIATILNNVLTAGEHYLEFDGSDLASGVYFYKLEAGQFSDQKKMVLIK